MFEDDDEDVLRKGELVTAVGLLSYWVAAVWFTKSPVGTVAFVSAAVAAGLLCEGVVAACVKRTSRASRIRKIMFFRSSSEFR